MSHQVLSLNEVLNKDITEAPINYTDCNGKCSGCGNCCPNILSVSEKEIQVIRKYIKKHHIKPHVLRLPLAHDCMDVTCPFLNLDKKTDRCMIYPVRPYICRIFQCNKDLSPQAIMDDKELTTVYREKIDMRKTFFN